MLTIELNHDMTIRVASPTISLVQRSAYWERFKGYILFTVLVSLYILPFMGLYLGGEDEGSLIYGAVRVLHGQVFARDFFEVIGPGTFYWLAAFFRLFGVTILATRICLFVTSLGTALSVYYLSRRVCRAYQALPCILLAALYCGGVWPAISHHMDSNLFALLAVACVSLWQDMRHDGLLLAAGAMVGLTTAFHQPKGMLLFCAILAWLWIQERPSLESLPSLGLLASGYLAVISAVLLYFWKKGALGSLIYANVVWPSRHYGATNSVPYAQNIFLSYWVHWTKNESGFRWTFPMSVILIAPFLYVAALPLILLIIGAWSRWNAARSEIMLYWLCGGAIWLAEIHRKDIAHLVFGSMLLVILSVHYLTESRRQIAGLALQMLSISAVCLVLFNLSCLFLAAHSVPTRVGSVRMLRYPPALSFLMEHVAVGEEIFVYPYAPQYYFLSSTTNPTPYSILVNNYNTPSQFRDVVRILDQHKVKYVIWNIDFARESSDAFPTLKLPPSGGLIVEPYLESHYRVVWDEDGMRVMERRGDENGE